MLFRTAPREKPVVTVEIVETVRPRNDDTLSEADLRRQMYERIAQGNALAEVEESARRRWHRN